MKLIVSATLNDEKIIDREIIEFFQNNPEISRAKFIRSALYQKIKALETNTTPSNKTTIQSKKAPKKLKPSDGFQP